MPTPTDRDYFLTQLYPLQDKVLAQIAQLDTGFYLTGGTAASRGYLQHRYSEDLKFVVNDAAKYKLWVQ